MRQSGNPKLTLLGAGPGDPDLITVKGLKKLAEADVVLYDALINTELLKYAPANSEKILVGKRSGYHWFTQEKINRMIVQYAKERGHVVRLKGGDPYIFGRGFEEYAHAIKFGIPVEVIPGISSATGLSASHHIPITMRGISESFWVVTGTTRDGKFSQDIKIAAQSTATVIILMGMKKLSKIVNTYQQLNKGHIPVMIIQNGTLANERHVYGNINTIEGIICDEGLSSPAAIIVGNVIDEAMCLIQENIALLSAVEGVNMISNKKPKGTFSTINIHV